LVKLTSNLFRVKFNVYLLDPLWILQITKMLESDVYGFLANWMKTEFNLEWAKTTHENPSIIVGDGGLSFSHFHDPDVILHETNIAVFEIKLIFTSIRYVFLIYYMLYSTAKFEHLRRILTFWFPFRTQSWI
jgi:hypothetical protein